MSREDKETYLNADNFRVSAPPGIATSLVSHLGEKLILGIRPEHIHAPDYMPPGIAASPVKAKVDVTEMMGSEVFVYLLSGKKQFLARLAPRIQVRPGQEIEVIFNMANLHLFDIKTDKALLFQG